MMSVKPSVAMNAVRAPRPSSRALVATVIPWENSATALASAPGRSSTARTAATTAYAWSLGDVGALAVIRRPSTASTASVKVPPTSTPRSIHRTLPLRCPREPRARASGPNYLLSLCGERLGQFLGLRQMLMGRAIAVVGQGHPLARRALAGAGTALQRFAVQVEPVVRLRAQELVGEPQVLLDHMQDAGLRAHREVGAHVVEQRSR